LAYNLRLTVSCPDRKGLISALSSFISMHDGNILSADQYVSDGGTFFMRLEIEGEGFGLARDEFAGAFRPLARRHGMGWHVNHTDTPKRMAVLVSRYDHCLTDLLWRWDAGELDAEVPLVVSNHPDLAPRVEPHGVPFHYLPVDPQTKAEQESRVLDLLSENRIDVVVLGAVHADPHAKVRGRLQGQAHKHPPFFPAGLRGGRPLPAGARARRKDHRGDGPLRKRGAGRRPIIHQDVAHVTHRDTVDDLVRLGREVERRVLARAVRLHLEDRILVDGGRTVVFE
jgi:formyltetrahydrofolate deformylase